MADHAQWRKNVPEGFDGRFGQKFDDEIKPRGILEMGIGLAVACILTFLIVWGMMRYYASAAEAARPAPLPVKDTTAQRLPNAPLLQAHPEAELRQMRREMAERLHGYGWTDEASGTVHIPIDKAFDLALERGLIKSSAGEAETPAVAGDAGEPAAGPEGEPLPAAAPETTGAGEVGH